MAPKKAPPKEEEPPKPSTADLGPKQPLPVWIYGINDHLEGPKELPSDFKRGLTLRDDYLKLCNIVGAVPHPALKAKPKVIAKPRREAAAKAGAASAATEATEWGAKGSPAEEKKDGPPDTEDPVLSIRSVLLDRLSVSLLSVLVPTATTLKVIVFSDCRLDVEMLRLLRDGLTRGTSLEALQIEWNPLEVPLPSEDDIRAEEAAIAAEAAAAVAAAAASEAAEGSPPPAVVEPTETAPLVNYDIEFRERRRYRMQSQRILRGFKDHLTDLFPGGLDESFAVLEAPGDADKPLNYNDFQGVIEDRLGICGAPVVAVFEVLDGPDYNGSEGCINLISLRKALEGLGEEVVREGVDDQVGATLASFMQPDCVLESLAFRACGIGRPEMRVMTTTLKQCPWTLRILNLWDNYLCDRCAQLLADACIEYRGLEYIGLGKNRITDIGLAAICKPFNWEVLDEAGLTDAREQIKTQQTNIEAAAKAKAKAKAAPSPVAKELRESPAYVDELRETPAEEEGQEPVWVFKRKTQLKTLNVSENPIVDSRALGDLQVLGPANVDLVLRGCPVTTHRLHSGAAAGPSKGRGSMVGFPVLAIDGGGWVLRMV